MDNELTGDANAQSGQLAAGQTVSGQYEVLECLGRGQSTTVYKVKHKVFDSHFIVLKVLHPELCKNQVELERFEQELTTSREVNHPNVIQSFELVKNDLMTAYTMEFAGGGDLQGYLEQHAPLSIENAYSLGTQICDALTAIHAKGIIHRDLKPANIFMTVDGKPKIADFGLVKTNSGRKLTQHGQVLGAVDYCSPEYIETSKLDHRSDIYALGLLMYEMVTGEFPFSGDSPMDTIMKRMTSDPEAPIARRPDCPQALSDIILKAVARTPEARYQSSSEMLEALQQAQSSAQAAVAAMPGRNKKTVAWSGAELEEARAALREEGQEPSVLPTEGASSSPAEANAGLVEEKPAGGLLQVSEEDKHASVEAFAEEDKKKKRTVLGIVVTMVVLLLAAGGALFLTSLDDAQKKSPAPIKPEAAPSKAEAGTGEQAPVTEEPAKTEPEAAAAVKEGEAAPEQDAKSGADASKAEVEEPTIEQLGALLEDTPEAPAPKADAKKEKAKAEVEVEKAPSKKAASSKLGEGERSYTVKRNDTVSQIADRFGVSTRGLLVRNNISDPRKLEIGDVLVIPSKKAAPPIAKKAKAAKKPAKKKSVKKADAKKPAAKKSKVEVKPAQPKTVKAPAAPKPLSPPEPSLGDDGGDEIDELLRELKLE